MHINDTNKAPITPRTADCVKDKEDRHELTPLRLFKPDRKVEIQRYKVQIQELKAKINSLKRFRQISRARIQVDRLKQLFYSSIHFKSGMYLRRDELVSTFKYYNELEKEKLAILEDKERQVEELLQRVDRRTIKRVIKSKNEELGRKLPRMPTVAN